ncbi:MAG: hypothetical protein JWO82_1938 [Akkermansiaceae bacterium]|nr:hypothetical protein [Akkermansiaceae bacterium]
MVGLAVAADTDVPAVEAVISAQVKAMPEPENEPIPKGFTMAITASDPKAQDHVLQGLNALHGGWDFEAYRHFCAALQLDPDCLMAHWGVAMALIDPQPDLRDESVAAIARMTALMEKKAGSELERSYAYALVVFVRDGAARAAEVFKTAAEQYPNDPQLKLLGALFGRGGYDQEGRARPGQEKAEKTLKDLLAADPGNPVLMYAYLAIKAEAPDLKSDLDIARKLTQTAPNYAPFQHMLGDYEWRCGNHSRAVEAFAKAGQGFSTWMKAVKVTAIDCPGWIKSECFRAVALASKGDYPTALAVAKAVAAIPVPADVVTDGKLTKSANGEGARLLLWEARTLPARLLMRRNGKGDVEAALASLPAKESQKQYGKGSLCTYFYQGLAFALEGRKAIDSGDQKNASQIVAALSLHGQRMQETQSSVRSTGEATYWFRAYEGLNTLAGETRGLLAMADKDGMISSAHSWYSTADDHQSLPSMLLPPTILLPMKARIAESYLAEKKPDAAVEVLEAAAKLYPNDFEVLTRLEQAYKAAKQPDEAATVAKALETLKSE